MLEQGIVENLLKEFDESIKDLCKKSDKNEKILAEHKAAEFDDELLNGPYSLRNIIKHWYDKGADSVKRKNKSGCCCIITDEGEVESPCLAHTLWKEA